ncbi:MAG: hypothetical protein LBR25_08000 [Erysipelotrichaceae bacterium]|jgi:hypothetical protein|nr:hypothetical protein [Erysipelotrichaceae bacterium]
MRLSELIEKSGFTLKNNLYDKEVEGVFAGDLLSWVMGHSLPGQAWISIQVHLNVVAVALLREFSCLIIAQDAIIPSEMIDKANEEQLTILASHLPVFETAKKLVELGF